MSETVLGVLVSGRGSNLQSIIDAIDRGEISAKVGVVISDNGIAYALNRARTKNIPTACVKRSDFKTKQEFDGAICSILKEYKVDLVVLAGFMRILGKEFVHQFQGRIMNIHPALLPAFTGLDAQAQAIAYGVKVAGCTVHFVDEGMDTGPIILQAAVPVLDHDTEETLSQRILEQEHVIYPSAVALFCAKRLKIEGRRVEILPSKEEVQ